MKRGGSLSYAIMRLEKRKINDIVGMENHNERKTETHSNCDIDLEKKHLNYDFVECNSYKKKIDEKIKKRYTGKKAIRKDAVICTEVLFTSDKAFFDKIGEEREKLFFEKSLEFLKEKFGEENIVSAKVHKDEETPHMHAVFVPLHSDGSLSMKKHINTKFDLCKLQDDFHAHISKEFPELERGQSAKETGAKHLEIKDLKKKTKYLEKQLKEKKAEMDYYKKYLDNIEITKNVEKIANSTEIQKNMFGKETGKVIMNYDDYIQMLAWATKGEMNEQEKLEYKRNFNKIKMDFNKKNDELNNNNTILRTKEKKNIKKIEVLEKEKTDLKIEIEEKNKKNKELENENISINKEKAIAYAYAEKKLGIEKGTLEKIAIKNYREKTKMYNEK